MTDDNPPLRAKGAGRGSSRPAPASWEPELEELRLRQALAQEMGGAERVERQHKGGRLTVRERIDRMLDPTGDAR